MLSQNGCQWRIQPSEREAILDQLVKDTLDSVDSAIDYDFSAGTSDGGNDNEQESLNIEVRHELGEERTKQDALTENLLDRLLYKAVLPRYAFPTDVASFHVFNQALSTSYRPAFHYTPAQSLPVALTQYAPGKEVWIDGQLWTSGAIYSPVTRDRFPILAGNVESTLSVSSADMLALIQ